jgi:hypothetical protein
MCFKVGKAVAGARGLAPNLPRGCAHDCCLVPKPIYCDMIWTILAQFNLLFSEAGASSSSCHISIVTQLPSLAISHPSIV